MNTHEDDWGFTEYGGQDCNYNRCCKRDREGYCKKVCRGRQQLNSDRQRQRRAYNAFRFF